MIGNSKNLFIEKGRFSELNFYLLNKLSEERKRKFKVSKKTVKGSKILKSENLDKISYLILFNEFKNKIKKDLLPVYKNEIRPFYFCSDKEIETYCKIKQIKINKEKPQKDNIMKFINEVEDKYSGTKINIAKSYLDIVNALN